MPVPSTRTPVRIARGTYAAISTTNALAALLEGEMVYATDQDLLYCMKGGALVAQSYAALDSPGLTGTPTSITPTSGDNSTKIATTAFVVTEIADLVDSAPASLDTLNELSLALNSDANFATTVTNSLALKAALADPTFSGTLTVSGNSVGTVEALTDAATVAVDLSLANNFSLLCTSGVGASRTLGTPSNATVGQSGVIWITQSAGAGNALVFESEYKFAGGSGSAPDLTTGTASAVDCLAYAVLANDKVLITPILNVA